MAMRRVRTNMGRLLRNRRRRAAAHKGELAAKRAAIQRAKKARAAIANCPMCELLAGALRSIRENHALPHRHRQGTTTHICDDALDAYARAVRSSD